MILLWHDLLITQSILLDWTDYLSQHFENKFEFILLISICLKYVLGAQKNCLIETVFLSIHIIC